MRALRITRFEAAVLVLIADADPAVRAECRAALERFGYRCEEAATGTEAWESIASGLPDVVLASRALPEIDGLQLTHRLRALQRTPACYFITMVDAADSPSLQAAMGSGADDFLLRPFHDEQLHARIQVAERFLLQARRLSDKESSLDQARHALRASARTDALTGLWNRLQLTDDLDLFQGQLQRYGHRYAAAIINLDRFRAYNDAHGLLAGDEVLRLVAETVAQKLRTGDRAYRYGGDELVVLLPEQTADSARIAADRIREAVEQLTLPHHGNPPSLVITVSVGVAAFAMSSGASYDALLGWAEAALIRAKVSGGNRVALDEGADR
jgi:two-component system, cell cycle response regulator